MVNIFEEFKKLENRLPTESELATLLKMQREQEGYKTGKLIIREQEEKKPMKQPTTPKREPKQPQAINDRSLYRWPRRASLRSKMINRMLKDNITIETIAYYLDVKESQVMSDITMWGLPQERNK